VFSRKTASKPISNADKLLSYAAWYYGRYAPPLAKLRAKLLSKSATESLAQEAFDRFSAYVSDAKNLESKTASQAVSGKPRAKVSASLLRKGFNREDVRASVENEPSFSDWEIRKPAVDKRLAAFAAKGRSASVALAQIRAEYPEFRDRLSDYVRETYPRDAEILSEFHSVPNVSELSPQQKNKARDRLLRAGFAYGDIARLFGGDSDE
jgi:SOS response regulatory protein OraA/RecX